MESGVDKISSFVRKTFSLKKSMLSPVYTGFNWCFSIPNSSIN